MYLKRFASRPGFIYRYDLLVPDMNCPIWLEKPLNRVASAIDLYTSIENGVEADDYERWLNQKYETPAEDALQRAVSGDRMEREDWYHLVNFLAAQDVRTPARLQEAFTRWQQEASSMTQYLKEAIEKYSSIRAGEHFSGPEADVEPGFPMRLLIRPSKDKKSAEVKVETAAGRRLWIWEQKQALRSASKHLHVHKWTTLLAPDGVTWPTSDNPVICLRQRANGTYDFKGGWNSEGTQIFMPLSPKHLLYTHVGRKRPQPGTILDSEPALMFAKFIREHAFRYIFSSVRDSSIPRLRPRRVNLEDYMHEKSEWLQWNEVNKALDDELTRPLPSG